MKIDLSTTWEAFQRHPLEKNFEPLYKAALPLVYTICVRLTGSVEDAEDACQCTFNRLIGEVKGRSVDSGVDAKAYICRTAVREADALKKRQSRRGGREMTMEDSNCWENVESKIRVEEQELRLTVEKILESLPDELRVPVQLHYLHGFTQQEVATMLEVPRTTIARKMKEGLGKLETKLRSEGITNAGAVLTTIAGMAVLLQPSKPLSAAAVWTAAGVTGGAAVATAGLASFFSAKVIAAIAAVAVMGVIALAMIPGSGTDEEISPSPSTKIEVTAPENGTNAGESLPTTEDNGNSELANESDQKLTGTDRYIPENEKLYKKTAPYRITGKVVDTEGHGVPYVTVHHANFADRRVTAKNSTHSRVDGSFDLWLYSDEEECLKVFGEEWAPEWYEGITPGTRDEPFEIVVTLEPGNTMKGIVRDYNGEPVEGATITVRRPDSIGSCAGMPGMFQGVRSQADGTFEYPCLHRGTLSISISATGLNRLSEETDASTFREFTLGEVGVIYGTVTDKDTGDPITDYNISFRYPVKEHAIKNSTGEFLFSALDRNSSYDLSFHADGFLPETLDKVSAWKAEEDTTLNIQLGRGNQVELDILDAETGDSIPQAKVLTSLYHEGWSIDWNELQAGWKPVNDRIPPTFQDKKWGETDDNGRFIFQESETSIQTIAIWTPGYERLMIRPVQRGFWNVGKNTYSILLQKEAVVEGITSWDNQVRPGCKVELTRFADETKGSAIPFSQGLEDLTSDKDGKFSWSSLAPGMYSLKVQLEESNCSWSTPIFDVEAGGCYSYNIEEALGDLTLSGKITEGGLPLKGHASIYLRCKEGQKHEMRTRLDGLGCFEIGQIKPGKYKIDLQRFLDNSTSRHYERDLIITDDQHLEWDLAPQSVTFNLEFPNGSEHGGWDPRAVEVRMMNIDQNKPGSRQTPVWTKPWKGKVTLNDGLEPGEYQLGVKRKLFDGDQIFYLPTLYQIKADQNEYDLGTIELPPLLPVKLKVDKQVEEEIGSDYVGLMVKTEDSIPYYSFIDAPPLDGQLHEIPMLPAGDYQVQFYSQKFPVEPSSYDLHLEPGKVPELTFAITKGGINVYTCPISDDLPDGVVMVPIKRATLKSHDGQIDREVLMEDARDIAELENNTDGEAIMDLSRDSILTLNDNKFFFVVFTNLVEGPATITMEADGYEPGTLEINMGDPDHHMGNAYKVKMKKLGE